MPQALETPARPAAAPPDERERHYVRNLALLTAVETGWGFGMAFGFSASFIQLVMRQYGASDTQIGFLAAQWGFSTFPMVLAGYFTGHLRRKKSVVVWGHYLCVIPVALLAAAVAWVPSNSAKIWRILAAEYAFGLSVGVLIPIWLTFMGKVMPPKKMGSGFGVTFFFQTLAGAGAGQLAAWILVRWPGNVAACIGITAVVMAVANVFFLPVREPEAEAAPRPAAFLPFLRELFGQLRTHPQMRALLAAELLFCAQYGIVGFYAARAADFGGNAATGATFTSVVAIAQAFSALLGGWLVDRIGPKPVLAAGRLAVAVAAVFAWRATGIGALIPAALCVGAFWGVRSSAGFAMFREVSGREEVTSLYGLFTLVVAPFAAAVPLVAGWGLSRHHWGAPGLFAVCGALVLVSVAVLVAGVRTRRPV
ncbi:MAG: MFS transporter [Planctomycetia bacterium]|nr:MFS transporter [Planctomycetia bacterium]